MKLSVITPSFNSGDHIEMAIKSVLAQDYANYEHIVIDGGSHDNTLEILNKYSHLKWISEHDDGQVHAMNKGFKMSSGDIIVYLNADDYFLDGAFSAVMPYFRAGEKIVMGKVLVRDEQPNGIQEWINDPEADFESMLRHWEPNAFCVNPVGYFYLRRIQEEFPFNTDNDDKQDLEFLLQISQYYKIKKIDNLLGVFNYFSNTKTARKQLFPTYWKNENFPFINALLEKKPPAISKKFQLERERGYMLRRYWTAMEAFGKGLAEDLFKTEEVFLFPEDEGDTGPNKGNFVEKDRLVMKGDWVIPVLTMGKVASRSVHQALKNLPHSVLPAQVYHLHSIDDQLCGSMLPGGMPHFSLGLSLGRAYSINRNDFKWKFITGVRDPIACGLSEFFQNSAEKASIADSLNKQIINFCNYAVSYYDNVYNRLLGLDILSIPFENGRGYARIVFDDNVEVLVYKFETLPDIFSQAMDDYLGIEGIDLPLVNLTSNKSCSAEYENAKHTVRFEEKVLSKIYNSKLVRHFYTEDEIETFIKRWMKRNALNKSTLTSEYYPSEEGQNNLKGTESVPIQIKSIIRNGDLSKWKREFCCIAKQKIAYLTIPKNACTTFKYAMASLKNPNINNEVLDRSIIHKNVNVFFDLVCDFKSLPEIFFSFTFVRNPYERFLSFYRNKILLFRDINIEKYMLQHGFYKKMSIMPCLEIISKLSFLEMNNHFAPQWLFVFHNERKIVDFIGKLESLNSDLKLIEKKTGVNLDLNHYNQTKNREDLQLGQEVLDTIYDIYELDFKAFGYDKLLDSSNWFGTIYDVGMHIGQDTEYYLKSGFRVIAIEANPLLVKSAEIFFSIYLQTGQLTILNVGIAEEDNSKLPFYINDEISEWSSFIKEISLRDHHNYHVMEIECHSLSSIIQEYGTAYYVKIDIEGHDEIALKSLAKNHITPKYISVENGFPPLIDTLSSMGYRQFKYIQQNNIENTKPHYPSKEGRSVEYVFKRGSSGPFGENLAGEWKSYTDIVKEIGKTWDYEAGQKHPWHRDDIHGWFDLHAKLK